MMKLPISFFEFEDLSWFPNVIREGMTDYLRYLIARINFYKPVIPLITEALNQTSSNCIIDLCSGGGGAIEQIQNDLQKQSTLDIKIILTDKYPNCSAFEYISAKTNGRILFSDASVDAADVSKTLTGFRTIFSGFHHFEPQLAKAVIQNAVDAKSGIGIFDGGDKNILAILFILIIHPIVFIFFTPFFQPFRFSRLLFTYFIPIIPLCSIWDGIVSIIRLYTPDDLLAIASSVDNETYLWKAGKMKSNYGMHVTYLIGYPN